MKKLKINPWMALGGLGAVAIIVALVLSGLLNRGGSRILVTDVRVEEQDGNTVLAWTGDNHAGTSCQYAPRLGGSARQPLSRGSFTAATELARPDAIAWLRVECVDGSTHTIPWDMSDIGRPRRDHRTAEKSARVEVASLQALRSTVTTAAKQFIRDKIRKELRAEEEITRVGSIDFHGFSLDAGSGSIRLSMKAEAEADIDGTTCDRVVVHVYHERAKDGLKPGRTSVDVDLQDSWARPSFWNLVPVVNIVRAGSGTICGFSHLFVADEIMQAEKDIVEGLLTPVDHEVRRWLVGAGVANVSVVDPLRELAEEGKLHASADIRGRVIEVRVTADREWIGPGAVDLGSATSIESGQAGGGTVSYALVNRLLEALSSTAIGNLRPAGRDGGVVGNVAAWVERFASDLAGSMAQMLGSNARIEVDEDLGFRLPLAVAPDGEHGVYAYLKGADFVKDSRGARRYRLWGEARTRLACPAGLRSSVEGDAESRADYMRNRVAITASSDGAPASGRSGRRVDLADFAGRWLRGELAGRMTERYSDPLALISREVASYCIVRTPMKIGYGFEVSALRNDLKRNAVVMSVVSPEMSGPLTSVVLPMILKIMRRVP